MKRYKNGKIIDTPKEEAEKLQRRFEKRRVTNRPSSENYKERIEALEKTVAEILTRLNEQKDAEEAQ